MYSSAYVWAKILQYLEERLSSTIVSGWFESAEVVELNGDHLILHIPSEFHRDMITAKTSGLINAALKEIFNSDDKAYGGSGVGNQGPIRTEKKPWHGQRASAAITVPPRGAVILKCRRKYTVKK